MENKSLIPISDLYQLALLDLHKIQQIKYERDGRRYIGFYERSKASRVLSRYVSGTMKVCLRDYVASLHRIKDRIFDSERV
jgi:hypothetical protein